MLSLTATFLTILLTHAVTAEHKDPLAGMTAKDAGDIHNRIMTQVDKRMKDNIPTEYGSYMDIALEEMLSLCGTMDEDCARAVNKAIVGSSERINLHQVSGKSLTEFDMGTIFPDEFDDDTRKHFESIHDALSLLKDDNIDDVLSAIDEVVEKVEKSDAHEMIKAGIVAAASVASGSTQYWMNARTDHENNFRRLQSDNTEIMRSNGSRETGLLNLIFAPINIVIADFIGAVVGSIDPIIDFAFAAGAASPTPILFGVVFTAGFDSLAATGIIIPAASTIVRCFLENSLTSVNCSIRELFCGETDLCK